MSKNPMERTINPCQVFKKNKHDVGAIKTYNGSYIWVCLSCKEEMSKTFGLMKSGVKSAIETGHYKYYEKKGKINKLIVERIK